jgi:hypothetical protein
MKRLLIAISLLGVAATVFAVLEGAWLLALATYGLSIALLCSILWLASARTRELAERAADPNVAELSLVGNCAYNGSRRPQQADCIGGAADCC